MPASCCLADSHAGIVPYLSPSDTVPFKRQLSSRERAGHHHRPRLSALYSVSPICPFSPLFTLHGPTWDSTVLWQCPLKHASTHGTYLCLLGLSMLMHALHLATAVSALGHIAYDYKNHGCASRSSMVTSIRALCLAFTAVFVAFFFLNIFTYFCFAFFLILTCSSVGMCHMGSGESLCLLTRPNYWSRRKDGLRAGTAAMRKS